MLRFNFGDLNLEPSVFSLIEDFEKAIRSRAAVSENAPYERIMRAYASVYRLRAWNACVRTAVVMGGDNNAMRTIPRGADTHAGAAPSDLPFLPPGL